MNLEDGFICPQSDGNTAEKVSTQLLEQDSDGASHLLVRGTLKR